MNDKEMVEKVRNVCMKLSPRTLHISEGNGKLRMSGAAQIFCCLVRCACAWCRCEAPETTGWQTSEAKPTPVHQFTYSYLSMTVSRSVLYLRSLNWFLAQLILASIVLLLRMQYGIACEKKERNVHRLCLFI